LLTLFQEEIGSNLRGGLMQNKMAGFLLAAIAVVVLFAAPELMSGGRDFVTTPPSAPEISQTVYYGIPYFGWIASVAGGLLGVLVIRRKYFKK